MDRDVVESGIRMRYKDKEDRIDSRQYLDKMVQIPFHVPPLSLASIKSFLADWFTNNAADMLSSAAPVISAAVERNPRSLKRTLNVLLVTHNLIALDENGQSCQSEPDSVCRLAKLVVIQTNYEAVHREMVAHPILIRDMEKLARQNGKHQLLDENPRLSEMLRVKEGAFAETSSSDIAKLVFMVSLSGGAPPADLVANS
jgi:hypothetical protein